MKGERQGGHSSHSCIWAREAFWELEAILSSWGESEEEKSEEEEKEEKKGAEGKERIRVGGEKSEGDLHHLVSKNIFCH